MDQVNGIISVNKPPELTSMEVVRRVKRLTRQKRVGHAGTLDPQATGVLPICFGQATRIMEYLVESPKGYRAQVQLGVSTDTYDSQGQVTGGTDPSHITREDVDRGLEAYRGVFLQVPPMYSALKQDGERLYNLARAGKEVERGPRKVETYRLEITRWDPPDVDIEVECGRGVYVRSLAHDLGEALGCGANLKALVRVRNGPFNVATATPMEELEDACNEGSWTSLLFPVDFPLLDLKAGIVQQEKEEAIRRGQGIYMGLPHRGPSADNLCRLYSADGDFVAVLRPGRTRSLWQAHKVFTLRPTPS